MNITSKLKEIKQSTTFHIIKYYREKFTQGQYDPEWKSKIDNNPESVYTDICETILQDSPCLISRFGSNELDATINYKKGHPLSLIRKVYPFWVSNTTKERMLTNAGFFPNDNKSLSHFADLIVDIVGDIDILGTWVGTEDNLPLSKCCKKVNLMYLEPFWSKKPWTATLKGKKVLVVHPFAESIRKQYERREFLFENKETLPEFASLNIVKAIQSIGGERKGFDTWFDALNYMEQQIDKIDYDIALIGCGAYGMPLAAHCKRMGKKAIHLGGALQLLFGIRGARWEADGWRAKELMNKYWVRPLENEKPSSAHNVENACYW